MYRLFIAVSTVCLFQTVISAEEVTFINRTPYNVLIRCIAPGNVPVQDEFSQRMGPNTRHARSNFRPGLRVVAAWTSDLKHCTAMPVRVSDGMQLTLVFDQEFQELRFEAPCADCASSTSERQR